MRNWQNNSSGRRIVLAGNGEAWTMQSLDAQVRQACHALRARSDPGAPVAILADNSPEWIAIDLAAHEMAVTLVPLPFFFSPVQMAHALRTAGVASVFCPDMGIAESFGCKRRIPYDGSLVLAESESRPRSWDERGVQKVTFTSGTTAEPKGVCLTSSQQQAVAEAIRDSLAPLAIRRHLSLLPFAVLLENVAGVYAGLLSGATCMCVPMSETGLKGASEFDPHACLEAIARYQAESVILLPQMLQALVTAMKVGDPRTGSLKYVAVGGAHTPVSLIHAARGKGLPVYEGYGLSECGSVVSLNLPGCDRPGSAGRPLPGRRVRIAPDGEVEVGGRGIAHYLGESPGAREWLATGDLGHVDGDGFLHIAGRKKNVLITAYGRNVSPEWPETTLLGAGAVSQAAVFGDGRPYLVAAIVSAAGDAGIAAAVERANALLPDYARLHRWFRAEPFTPHNGMATANGRPRREAIAQHYREQIASAYANHGE